MSVKPFNWYTQNQGRVKLPEYSRHCQGEQVGKVGGMPARKYTL